MLAVESLEEPLKLVLEEGEVEAVMGTGEGEFEEETKVVEEG
jgi:hypothetical protein